MFAINITYKIAYSDGVSLLNNKKGEKLCYLLQDLTRFAIQAKGPDGKWTRKPLAYRESNNVHVNTYVDIPLALMVLKY